MNNTEWIRKESNQWVADGIITPEQNELIQMRYPANKAGSPLLLLFAVVGSLLIGAGMILIFATNWWKIPVAVKIIIAFIPLLAAQGVCVYTLVKKPHSVSFREGAVVFLSLSFFAALALIGQVFHTPSNLDSYIGMYPVYAPRRLSVSGKIRNGDLHCWCNICRMVLAGMGIPRSDSSEPAIFLFGTCGNGS